MEEDKLAQSAPIFGHWTPAVRQQRLSPSAFGIPYDVEPTQSPPLVVIVENDAHNRSVLSDMLKTAGVAVVAFASADELLDTHLADYPGCFIINVQLPGLSGLNLYQHLNTCGLNQPVIFLTTNGDTAMTVEAMKAGAVDVLLTPVCDQNLLEAVTLAIALNCTRRDAAKHLRIQTERVAALTPREFQVMQGVTIGRLNKQIAFDLGISEITVKAHRGNVMRKLCARSICDLVRTWDMLAPHALSNSSARLIIAHR